MITIRIHQYHGPSITVSFLGDIKPQGFIDWRIVDQWTKTIVKANTGWERI